MKFLLFPHQLFKDVELLKKYQKVILIEHPIFFNKYNFNKKKLILHKASCLYYVDYLLSKKINVEYIPFEKFNGLTDYRDCDYYEVVDKDLEKELGNNEISTPNFTCTRQELTDFINFQKKKKLKKIFVQTSFYKFQRERLNLLMKNGKPIGNKLTYDGDNQNPLPKDYPLPHVKIPSENKYVKDAIVWVNKHFPNNYGNVDDFWVPVTHKEAQKWLNNFIKERLNKFGEYQDAITERPNKFLFHSGISAIQNIGLLNPLEVCEEVIKYGEKKKIEINNIEGFIRQIIGWREFSRLTYYHLGDKMKGNYLKNKKKVGKEMYLGTTGLLILDDCIKKAFNNGYLHHIERLMVVCNLCNLIGYKPNDIFKWFMEFSVDSYDWVMVNNVYSMGLYADGGLITSKVYVSSSNYDMFRGSDYRKGEWCDIWDALYWNFIRKNLNQMKIMGRFGPIQAKYWIKKPEKEKNEIIKLSTSFIKKL